MLFCYRCKEQGKPYIRCPNYLKCPYFKEHYANCVVNKFEDHAEVIVYKENFALLKNEKAHDYDRTRKWFYNENGYLEGKGDATFTDLKNSIKDSRKRALDNFYGYVLSNDWQYWITLTFDPKVVNRYDHREVGYAWQKFRQKMQYINKDAIIIAAKEKHKKGGFHLHALVGDIDLMPKLVRAVNNDKTSKNYRQVLNTPFGDPIYNFKEDFYNYGLNTVIHIKECNRGKIANYMSKYMAKEANAVDYNKQTYFRTRNLKFKDKIVANMEFEEIQQLFFGRKIVERKNNDKMVVYLIE